ncbi:MAG: triosephosphate isomerase [Candidatus Chisholmbacteria bacterium]|nr:triosephosphate isomerase [Candidatus Chisholmbacteria bacterium]
MTPSLKHHLTYLIANWKANKTPQEAQHWLKTVSALLPSPSSHLKLILLAPFIHLGSLARTLPRHLLGVQNLSPFPDGAYTGEISARMVAPLASFALLGHSERRHYFHETSAEIGRKVTLALEEGITPILAVSHTTWREQLNQLSEAEKQSTIIMYEPPEAISRQVGPIGQGSAAPLDEVITMIKEIKKSTPQSPVLYGGSVKHTNLADFLKSKVIDGVVSGSASLNAEEWLKLIEITQRFRG